MKISQAGGAYYYSISSSVIFVGANCQSLLAPLLKGGWKECNVHNNESFEREKLKNMFSIEFFFKVLKGHAMCLPAPCLTKPTQDTMGEILEDDGSGIGETIAQKG